MKTFYFHLFFGEVHPFQIRAESFDAAIIRAFEELRDYDGMNFLPVKLVEENTGNGNGRIYLDCTGHQVHVGLYDGDEPWTVKVPSQPGNFIDGEPIEDSDYRTDYTNLGEVATIIDMETDEIIRAWEARY